MKTSNHQWEKSTFVSAAHVHHKKRAKTRAPRRFSTIIRADQIVYRKDPVPIGEPQDNIRVTPIFENGKIKSLRVSCTCGCEATFDIQYQQEGAAA
ncbi:MAG: hypothetical protein JXR25_04880 [Pontiellaceae bacterium]|nr:hypothetical protein [Pontiellaceae bacterium]MBN2784141.1 hypothetical protein [Pontiellaceae bacterium]